MRKRTSSCEYKQIDLKSFKRLKLRKVKTPGNKEIYAFKRNSFRTFDTPPISGFCLHTTESLIAISCEYEIREKYHYVIRIYTLDGDLITIIGVSTVEDIYLSATMMITSFDSYITRYNDYNVKDSLPYFSPFTCDANDNIYTIPFREDRYFNAGISCIRIYSSDLDYVKPFNIQDNLGIYSIRILGDTMAILAKYMRPPYDNLILLYSLSKEELLQTVVLSDKDIPRKVRDVTICFDPLCNVLINCYPHFQPIVLYFGGRIRHYYKPDSISYNHPYTRAEMTKDFQLIQTIGTGAIRVYDKADVLK